MKDVDLIGEFIKKYSKYNLPVTIDKQLDLTMLIKDLAQLYKTIFLLNMKDVLDDTLKKSLEGW